MEVDGTVAVLIHLLQSHVHLLLAHIIPQSPQQKLQGPTGDVARVVAVVHLEDFLQLLDLLHLVRVELLHILQLPLGAHWIRFEGGTSGLPL